MQAFSLIKQIATECHTYGLVDVGVLTLRTEDVSLFFMEVISSTV